MGELLALLPALDLSTGIALVTAALSVLGYLAARRQAVAAERANALTQAELATTTAQSAHTATELVAVLDRLGALHTRIEEQQQAIEECHRERAVERAARERLEAQLQSERMVARVRMEALVDEMRAMRHEYAYLKEVYVALSGGWVDTIPPPRQDGALGS